MKRKPQQLQSATSRQRLKQKVYIHKEDIKIVPTPGRGSGAFAARDLTNESVIRYGGSADILPTHLVGPSMSNRLIQQGEVVFRPRTNDHPTCFINDPREHLACINSCLSKVNCAIVFFSAYQRVR